MSETAAPAATPSGPPPAAAPRIALRTAAIMLAFTLVFTSLMAGVYQFTQPILLASAADAKRRLINEVLPPEDYDNNLLADALELPPIVELGTTEVTRLYRARKHGEPAALVFEAVAPDGYSGRVGLILAVRTDGRLAAVRVTQHKETPGLGDYIDPKKDKNKARPWITQFDGRSLIDPPAARWRVKKDGGVFEQRAGATISARAVIHATARALAWATANAERLYTLPAGSTYQEKGP
ncbi:electron transport complex subunit RsxG [Sulfuricystis multivorans]|uniref:electron transport complex subunit RsxG n=1 Tax=Sulfuricystis multivorans TaxID=2211108 RepID=UPI000F845D87|nr:electron transport complex subunit RsxG [Sulfuricystis multivorans]